MKTNENRCATNDLGKKETPVPLVLSFLFLLPYEHMKIKIHLSNNTKEIQSISMFPIFTGIEMNNGVRSRRGS